MLALLMPLAQVAAIARPGESREEQAARYRRERAEYNKAQGIVDVVSAVPFSAACLRGASYDSLLSQSASTFDLDSELQSQKAKLEASFKARLEQRERELAAEKDAAVKKEQKEQVCPFGCLVHRVVTQPMSVW